jgi:hypothetical protein
MKPYAGGHVKIRLVSGVMFFYIYPIKNKGVWWCKKEENSSVGVDFS